MHKNNRDVTAADKRSLKRIRKRIAAALLGAAMAVSSFQTAYATKQDVEAAKILLRQEMENAVQLKVPLSVDCGVGISWYDAK